MLLDIPDELMLRAISSIGPRDLARLAMSNTVFTHVVLEELQRRRFNRGYDAATHPIPIGFQTLETYRTWLERIRDAASSHGFNHMWAYLAWLEWITDAASPFHPLIDADSRIDEWRRLIDSTPSALAQYAGVIAREIASDPDDQCELTFALDTLMAKLEPVAIAHIAFVLVEYIDDDDSMVRTRVLKVIGHLTPALFEKYVDIVVSILSYDHHHPRSSLVIVAALGALGKHPAVLAPHFDLVAQQLSDQCGFIRRAAIVPLHRTFVLHLDKFGKAELVHHIGVFVQQLAARDWDCHIWSLFALLRVEPVALAQHAGVFAENLNDNRSRMRCAALRLLCHLDPTELSKYVHEVSPMRGDICKNVQKLASMAIDRIKFQIPLDNDVLRDIDDSLDREGQHWEWCI